MKLYCKVLPTKYEITYSTTQYKITSEYDQKWWVCRNIGKCLTFLIATMVFVVLSLALYTVANYKIMVQHYQWAAGHIDKTED